MVVLAVRVVLVTRVRRGRTRRLPVLMVVRVESFADRTDLAVTYLVGSALPGYPITLLWALVAIIVNAAGRSTVVVAVAAIGIAAVIAAYLASRRRHDRLVVAAGSTA